VSQSNASAEFVACILVWCAEHGINTDTDYVTNWLDAYWFKRFEELDAEAATVRKVAHGQVRIVVCEPANRCGDSHCPVCGAH